MHKSAFLNSQQLLIQLICSALLSPDPGIAIYQRNRWALAERALAISFPTVAQLVGENFAHLARAYLVENPHNNADWGDWGESFPTFIAAHRSDIGLDYLTDVAQLDWRIHSVERHDNTRFNPASLDCLAQHPPERVSIRLNPNVRFLRSEFPLKDIWMLHQPNEDFSFWLNQAKGKLNQSGNDFYFVVSRRDWRARAIDVSQVDYRFMQGLRDGYSLGEMLDDLALQDFDFSHWLTKALREEWIQDICYLHSI